MLGNINMKVTKSELRNLIKNTLKEISINNLGEEELVALGNDSELIYNSEKEGYVSKQNLENLARYSQSLHDTLPDDYQLPDWAENKISIAKSHISDVKHYLDYNLFRKDKLDHIDTKKICS
jgi:hypothetical protein